MLQLQAEDKPPHVVSVLLDKLNVGTEDELEWLEHSVKEIVTGTPAFMHSRQAMGVLQDSLGLDFLSKGFVETQLKVSPSCCCQLDEATCFLLDSLAFNFWLDEWVQPYIP